MSGKYHIPQHLDEPFKIILWTLDELFALVVPFLFCMLFLNYPLTGLIVGVVLMVSLKKLKGEQGHFFLYNLMYWYLPQVIRFKKMPPSYLRQWIG